MPQLLLCLLCCVCCFSVRAQAYLSLTEPTYGLDSARALLLIHLPEEGGRAAGVRTPDGQQYTFIAGEEQLTAGRSLPARSGVGDTITVAFTGLPLVKVTVDSSPDKVRKRPGTLSYVRGDTTLFTPIGIRLRGAFSILFPKKTFDLECRRAVGSQEEVDVAFGDLRSDDDWVLDAVYNEPLRVNAYVAHKLWLEVHELLYRDKEPEARAGADVEFVELFFNGDYHGLYLLSEQVDRKLLRLKKEKDGQTRGELYKGVEWTQATQLARQPALPADTAPAYTGWERKYPESGDWTRLHALLGFTAHSTDAAFTAKVSETVDLDNVIDYFLYINALGLRDNSGKNTYLARYRQEAPYFYVPWDLDGSIGNQYDGSRLMYVDFWLSNRLLDRLIELDVDQFTNRLCGRYEALRQQELSVERLMQRVTTAHRYLDDNGAYARESLRWEKVAYGQEALDFTEDWLRRRMAYLDTLVCGFVTSTGAPVVEGVGLYPNPADRELIVEGAGQSPLPYRIIAVGGRVMLEGVLPPGQQRLDVSDLPGGMYVLWYGGRTGKFVVSH